MTAERACVPDAEREREREEGGGGCPCQGGERTTARDGIPRVEGGGGTKVWIVKQQRRRKGAGARGRKGDSDMDGGRVTHPARV